MSTGPHEPPHPGTGPPGTGSEPVRADRRAFLGRASTAAVRTGLAALSGGLGAVVLRVLDPEEPSGGADASTPGEPHPAAPCPPHRPGHDPCLAGMPPHPSK